MVKVAYTVGRFQPPTIGHRALIQSVIDAAGPDGKAYVFVSKETSPKAKNPLTSDQKLPILTHMFPSGVTFVNTAKCGVGWDRSCGGGKYAFDYLVEFLTYKPEDITLVVGNDRQPVFGPDADTWNRPETDGSTFKLGPGGRPPKPENFVFLATAKRDGNPALTDAANMSGTKARGYVERGEFPAFLAAVGYTPDEDTTAPKAVYDAIRASLKLKGGSVEEPVEESAFDADDEPTGGRRKTTRRQRKRRKTRRSKASGRA